MAPITYLCQLANGRIEQGGGRINKRICTESGFSETLGSRTLTSLASTPPKTWGETLGPTIGASLCHFLVPNLMLWSAESMFVR
jgi:hypothetical protein